MALSERRSDTVPHRMGLRKPVDQNDWWPASAGNSENPPSTRTDPVRLEIRKQAFHNNLHHATRNFSQQFGISTVQYKPDPYPHKHVMAFMSREQGPGFKLSETVQGIGGIRRTQPG